MDMEDQLQIHMQIFENTEGIVQGLTIYWNRKKDLEEQELRLYSLLQ